MSCPKISIITVCFNSEAHIEEAIRSVLNQSYANKEYIIIDGGSTDGTLDIINKYRDQVAYFVSEPDRGISDAFNKGVRAASGDLVGIINSDDKLEENALQIVADNYAEDIEVYRGITIMWNDKTDFFFFEHPTMDWPKVPFKLRVAHQSTFVAKKAYEKYGLFDVDLKYAMDFDLLLRFDRNSVSKKYIDSPLAYYRLGGVSQSNEQKRTDEMCRILRKNGASLLQMFLFKLYYVGRLRFKWLVVRLFGEEARFFFARKL